jgi:chromosome partitioning protein
MSISAPDRGTVSQVIVVTAALKGGVGKTTTSVYLAALAASNRRTATLIDADPQASAAECGSNASRSSRRRPTGC